jgi:hypothetical protein
MTDDQVVPKLSAALQAQASVLGSQGGRQPPKRRMPGWAVLALATVLGATAGGLAGVISTW